ncbi:MAG: hypothetical protein JWM87_4470 [Candidatus Eremiobacteraeota bacterium]|nr:hypothetical protein [Candidatus Eremiobacteraeota bacterium]
MPRDNYSPFRTTSEIARDRIEANRRGTTAQVFVYAFILIALLVWKRDWIFGQSAGGIDVPACLGRAFDAESAIDAAAQRHDETAVAKAYDDGASALAGCSKPAAAERDRDIVLARAEAAAWRRGERSFTGKQLPRIVR